MRKYADLCDQVEAILALPPERQANPARTAILYLKDLVKLEHAGSRSKTAAMFYLSAAACYLREAAIEPFAAAKCGEARRLVQAEINRIAPPLPANSQPDPELKANYCTTCF